LHTACLHPPLRASADSVFCGRKKLPFAGYSIVKECVEATGCQPFSHQPVERRLRGQPLSNSCEGRERCRSTNLPILLTRLAAAQAGPEKLSGLTPIRPVRLLFSQAGLPAVARSATLRPAFAKASADSLHVHSRAKAGGEYRARTGDLLVANQALSQLS
jgi:hypothetical protein